MDTAPVKQGDILAGKYRVERVIGVGGMGIVVAATHLDLLEPRALKFMLPASLGDADAVERFVREARAAAKLKSERVAKVHDVGRLDNGAPYMVMEYLEGEGLDAVLKKHGPLLPSLAALYTIQVCEALAEAHSLGIIHRDLKPSNLFLTHRPDGSPCVKVLDFGISKMISAGPDLEMTRTQAVLGSPNYMSPEQMRSARSVDPRTDIWSLGVILYRLTTGRLPFHGQNITELITLVLEAQVIPPSQLRGEIPPAMDAVILRCLQRDREDRFSNVAELAAALAELAPPGAGVQVESMNRILSSAPMSARIASQLSIPPSARLSSAELVPASGRAAAAATPAPSMVTAVVVAAATAVSLPMPVSSVAVGRPAEQTSASWGNTASRLSGRAGRRLTLMAIVGAAMLTMIIGVLLLGRSPPESAPADAALAMPSDEAQPSALPVAPAPPPLVTEPSVAPSARAVAPSASAVVAKPSIPGRPAAPSKRVSDPFGRGRK